MTKVNTDDMMKTIYYNENGVIKLNLNDYGFTSDMLPENAAGIPARITAVHKERYALVCEYGDTFGRLKTKEYYGGDEEFPTAGDFVLINYIPNGDSQIIATLPRRTYFSRRDPDPSIGEQTVAANFDYVFIMQSLNHDFNIKRLERYLTLSWQSGATPVVILTKADLITDCSEQIDQINAVASGAAICAVSAMTGFGLDSLDEYLRPGKTIVFLGSSGVGKSSLVNALAARGGMAEEIMPVSGIREDDSKGRHTTTHRQLIMLPDGVMVIDTPGMREMGMWDVTNGLGDAFADVEEYIGKCRFKDCGHQTEPGCAVREAIERGELSPARWESYCALRGEAEYSDDKVSYLKKKQQRNKSIAKKNRLIKTEGGNKYK